MATLARGNETPALRASVSEVTWLFILGYGAGAFLMVTLIYWGGVWDWMANTRILRFLFEAGIVALTDRDQGFIYGVPDAGYFRAAYDAVSWIVVLFAIALLFLNVLIKAFQFHFIALLAGSQGGLGQHTRAFIYGEGLARLLPFNFGSTATVSALMGQGVSERRARFAVYVSDLFVLFEIAAFALVAAILFPLPVWIEALFWPVIILAGANFLIRGRKMTRTSKKELGVALWQTLSYLARQPFVLFGLCLLSILAFLLVEFAAYLILSAYTGEYVLLQIEHELIILGLVAGNIARLVQVTPGGIGQFEWGMAAALYLSGVGVQEAMTIPILYHTFRLLVYVVSVIVVGGFMGIETSFKQVMANFRGQMTDEPASPQPQASA